MENKTTETPKEDFSPDFLIIPKEVMKMPPADRFVMGAIYFFSRLSLGKCIASNVEIGRVCGITPHSVTNSLDRLEAAGLIKRFYKDEEKRNRTEIACLVGFGRLESSGILQSSALVSTRVSSKKGHISNTIKNNNTTEGSKEPQLNVKERFEQLLKSNKRELAIIAYYTLKKKNYEGLTTEKQVQAVIGRNIKVARRLAAFDSKKIKDAIDECESTIIKGSPMRYTLETVERFLLK